MKSIFDNRIPVNMGKLSLRKVFEKILHKKICHHQPYQITSLDSVPDNRSVT